MSGAVEYFCRNCAVQISINNNRDFTILQRDGNENVNNNESNITIGLVNKTTALHLHPTFF